MTPRRRNPRKTGTPEWVELGAMLAARRPELDPDWDSRAAFARAQASGPEKFGGLLKIFEDIENNTRENFTPVTLRDTIAPAYQVTFESIQAVLRGEGGLEAAPGAPPVRAPYRMPQRRQRAVRDRSVDDRPAAPHPRPGASAGHDSMRLLMQSPGYQDAVGPFYEPIRDRILKLPPGTPATGQNVFREPGEEFWAAQWDQLARQPKADGSPMTADDLAVSIATIRAVLAARQSGSGETRAGLGKRAVIAQLLASSPAGPGIPTSSRGD